MKYKLYFSVTMKFKYIKNKIVLKNIFLESGINNFIILFIDNTYNDRHNKCELDEFNF